MLKLDENTKNIILEVSALSGYAQNVVKEIIEYLLLNWSIKIADHPDDFAELTIPYVGTLGIKYLEDKLLPTDEIETEIETYVEVRPEFKKLIGDLHDEGYIELIPMLKKKIESAVMVASTT